MKTNLKYMAFAALAFFSSCTKELDIVPEGSPSAQNFWKTKEDAIKAEAGMYENYNAEDFYGRGMFWFINASDDMVTGRNKPEADNIKNFNRTYVGGGYTETQWSMRYAIIKRANDIIINVPAIAMDETLKKQIIGDAYFNAGLVYFQLAANYGNDKAGVPIVTPESDPSQPIARAKNVNENYDYIISLLLKAADNLPLFSAMKPADYGKAHKTAAWAYLSKVYLYKKDYANAAKYADMVITSGQHDLVNTGFADVFKAANNWSKEYIWSVVCTPSGGGTGWGSKLPGVMLTNKAWGIYNGWGYYLPTKELYDSYETGDQRREATILKPGDKFMFFGAERSFTKDAGATSNYQFKKYMEPFSYANPIPTHVNPNGDNGTTDLNVPLMRYAEVLLIKAEAAINLSGAGAGDTELNKIRLRAGLGTKTGMTIDDLKRERRNELAGEWADRHRDLVRWGDAQVTYAKPLHDFDGSVIWPARTFNPQVHDVWAVPQREIDNSAGVIKQSPGW
ncbi:SusD-like protein BACOVA_02651 [Pedobacter sp. Bi27]|uniref:RagB/SusD family nutrient uptake outer membrane protein n=1 Tax=unclassified Pedobacter TaxID=2628915 RepID=UPI001D73873E|nr:MULTISPECIES: RagB/SusD family nutrient uptake outer membrane protein [unclassified Pedobacter]CAH0130426.1 SusD-like protein BACOVA_02651 [Pedobacter sp. Bi126]CAH0130875.1 SusD-like protein BACOVA_02651 [Pedobacter sp. Bi27]CAH0227985.1 SusD-like protein BACOVA_02651 [Pedobacter sp. Bi36]